MTSDDLNKEKVIVVDKSVQTLFIIDGQSKDVIESFYMIGESFEMVKHQFDFINLLVSKILRNYISNFERIILTMVEKMDE